MKIYLAEGGALFKQCYDVDISRRRSRTTSRGYEREREREREREDLQVYLAGIERLKSDMNIYLSTSSNHGINNVKKNELPPNIFDGTNILQSFYYCNDFTEKVVIPSCKNFLLDSGAFSFMSGKASPDWNKYIDAYADFINRNSIKHYFELDIDSIVGFDTVLEIRANLERKTGLKPIPVWHKARGLERFKQDASEYPYVAIGGIVTQEIRRKDYDIFIPLINEAHKRGAMIHGLGFTNLEGLKKYHFDSVDSTAWVSGNRFGAIYYFNGKTIKKIDKPDGKKVKSSKTALHNFNEWVKFCNYAEKYL